MTTGVKYRSLEEGNRTSPTTKHDMLFDAGLKGEMGEFGDYFKTWNSELGFRYSRDEAINLSQGVVSAARLAGSAPGYQPSYGLQSLLKLQWGEPTDRHRALPESMFLCTIPPYLKRLQRISTLNGDLFNLPAGPISFAVGAGYRGERYEDTPDSLNTTFNTIGSTDLGGLKS